MSAQNDDDKDLAKSITFTATPRNWSRFNKQFKIWLVGKDLDYVIDHEEDTSENCEDATELEKRKKNRKRKPNDPRLETGLDH